MFVWYFYEGKLFVVVVFIVGVVVFVFYFEVLFVVVYDSILLVML